MVIFHDAEPIHTHPHCMNCFKMRVTQGPNSNMKLLRCSRCSIATYCHKECQKQHWVTGHKEQCNLYDLLHKRATTVTGAARAWPDLTAFVEYHHATLVNCALALYLQAKPREADPTASHVVQFRLRYRADPALAPHMQFDPVALDFLHRSESDSLERCSRERERAVSAEKFELGTRYATTGAYLILVEYPNLAVDAGTDAPTMALWKHFGVDGWRWKARPKERSPWVIFKETVDGGKKMRFCCGEFADLMVVCSCGGWSHMPGGQIDGLVVEGRYGI